MTAWSAECHMNCLKSATPPVTYLSPGKPSEPPDLSVVPSVYHDLMAVFSKDEACSLPPYRPYDCAIDLLPGAPFHLAACIALPSLKGRPWRNTSWTHWPRALFDHHHPQ